MNSEQQLDMQNIVMPLLINTLFMTINFIPATAVQVRRLHDMDRSGWWVLLKFVPYVGIFGLYIWLCFDGTEGDNRFGAPVVA